MKVCKVDFSCDIGLKLGFAVVLFLMIALMAIAVLWMQRIDRELDAIVKYNITKIELVYTMQTALRERAIGMHAIVLLQDPFEKDEEFQRLSVLAGTLIKARTQLENMRLNHEEKAALATVRKVMAKSENITMSAVGRALDTQNEAEKNATLDNVRMFAIPAQREVAVALNTLVDIQTRAARKAGIAADQAYEHALAAVLTVGLFGTIMGIVVAIYTIRNATRQANTLRLQALSDPLTGLPNRVLFRDRLQRLALAGRRSGGDSALLTLDLNRFKEINDTLGHPQGDQVLKRVAKRILECARESDTVARMGGDEFAMLLPATGESGARVVAEKVLSHLSRDFVLGDRHVDVGASIGIAIHPQHGTDAELLLRHADSAMYEAKRNRTGVEVYDPSDPAHDAVDVGLNSDLRHAIERRQLILHYQPRIDHRSSKITGVEALVRWQHPVHGLIPPDRFIPMAEQIGVINALTEWVLNESVNQCTEWHGLGYPMNIAVNLSAINLKNKDLPARVAAALQTHGLDAQWLELEVTETALLEDTQRTFTVMSQLQAMGVRISIDDYGTGYSSLSHLRKLPADIIKIDRSFVMGMATNADDATIVRSTIRLGHELGLSVVAEGVEDIDTWKRLTELQCDAAQGYFMSRPLLPADLMRWMEQSDWSPWHTPNERSDAATAVLASV